jgi:hypothetical protein
MTMIRKALTKYYKIDVIQEKFYKLNYFTEKQFHTNKLISNSSINFQSTPNDKIEELYKKCKTTNILCYAFPSNCIESKNCELILGINSDGYVGSNGTVEFELIGKAGEGKDMDQWIATGLSDDDIMGNDSVVECLVFKNGTTLFRNSWNSGFSNYVINDEIVVSGNVSYDNGLISCKWLRMPYTKVKGMTFNLIDNEYYIMLAKGKLANEQTGIT